MANMAAVDFSDPEFDRKLALSDKGELPAGEKLEVVHAKEDEDLIEVDITAKPKPAKVAPGSQTPLAPLRKEAEADTGDEDGAGTLRAQLDREKAARKAAEDRAKASETELRTARTEGDRWRSEAEGAKYNEIVSAIGNVATKLGDLSSQWEAAMADGDFKKGAGLNTQMLELQAINIKLQEGKVAMEHEAQRPKVPTDVVEAYIAQNQITNAASAAWIRSHPEVATDPAKSKAVLRAHNAFLGDHDKEDVGTPDYYAFIETKMGYRAGAAADDAGDSPLSEAGRTAERTSGNPPAAPPSRAGSVDIGSKQPRLGNKITLSAAEREMAKMSGLTDLEYAQNKAALLAEGRIGVGY